MIKYKRAEDLEKRILEIGERTGMTHINFSRVVCIRSHGSKSKHIIARCHALPRIFQYALKIEPYYIIEVISEKFDKLSWKEQTKTLIHELMHIPKSFGGGFVSHVKVNRKNVEKVYKKFLQNLDIKNYEKT